MASDEYKAKIAKLIAAARHDFLAYYLLFNNPATSGKVCGDLQRYLIQRVQDIADGVGGSRQALSVPPQHTKSTTVTIEGMSWILGRFPGTNVGITGYSHSLATKFSKQIRDRVSHPWYSKLVFPGSEIVFGSNQMSDWEMMNGSGLRARSAGAKFTGHRVDYLVIDDPHKGRAEAESETQRQRVLEWYLGDCKTRLSPDGKVLLIGTRFHPEDLIGYLTGEEYEDEIRALGQEQELFEVTNLPAICEDPDSDPLGREVGRALFPRSAISASWKPSARRSPTTSGNHSFRATRHRRGAGRLTSTRSPGWTSGRSPQI